MSQTYEPLVRELVHYTHANKQNLFVIFASERTVRNLENNKRIVRRCSDILNDKQVVCNYATQEPFRL